MENLSLRLRVFLFFCLLALGGMAVMGLAVWLGYRQLDDANAMSAFITTGAVAAFGLAALAAFVWLLFDENVAKPLERLAADLRARAHGNVNAEIEPHVARYLGDIAPAVAAINRQLSRASEGTAETVAQQTQRLEREKQQLVRILSDIPIAVMIMNNANQIVLYDGQAAALLEGEAPARLNASLFDYLDESEIRQALKQINDSKAMRLPITINGRSGAAYSGHIRSFGEQAGYSLMLESLDPDADRPLTYDFELLDRGQTKDLEDTHLRDLCYVVFDSETTGLLPHKDEVVQVGAVRVVNGRCVPGEVFESLVNPGIPIPASSTKVHQITDEMVRDAPDIVTVGKAFHAYCAGAVMVAHNAPFDMAFLHRHSGRMNVRFDHPVLDTVLLSAAVFGGSAKHTLGALSERLGITIPPHLRHTAMGDAVATAEVFTRMLPILEARGIKTFGDALTEMRKHTRLVEIVNS